MNLDKGLKYFINGSWVAPVGATSIDVINPATEQPFAKVALGTKADVDRAVAAARAAFPAFAATSREERLALLEKIAAIFKRRFTEMGETISREMGAPISFATRFQAGAGMGHFRTAHSVLKDYPFEEAPRPDGNSARAGRRHRHDHAVELADEPGRLQGRARDRRRLHHDPEAVRVHAVLRAAVRGSDA
jgi:acyl-CoA reductase-like NAD-dependent aldehyde dehydrogenase